MKTKIKNKSRIVIWLFAFICILALAFSVSMFFTTVNVSIKPKIQSITLDNEVYTASLKTTSAQDFPFEVIFLDKETFQTIESSSTKRAEIKALGSITINNSYSTAEQELASSTRFSLPDGRIYRLTTPVTVPGLKKINGKDVPGTVTTNVIADKAGDSYNIISGSQNESLKILSYKGTPKYIGFNATLNGDVTGGFSGQKNVISLEKEAEIAKQFQDDLQKLILAELIKEKKDIFYSTENLNYISYSPLSLENDGANIKAGMKVSLNSIVFNKKKLAFYIASKKLADFNNLQVEGIIPDNFKIQINSTSTAPWLEKKLDITLNGKMDIKWIFDTEKIRTDLVGKSLSELSKVKAKYNGSVSDITPRFNLFWQIFFPDDINKIKVEE